MIRRASALGLVAVVAVLLPTLAGCTREKVRVAFRPPMGAVYRYRVQVESVTLTRLGTDPSERAVDSALVEAEAKVIASSTEEVKLQVLLRRQGAPDRTFLLRFDRAAQLAGVEAVDGLPPEGLGPLSLPELLPAAAAAPPDRPLAPGERWKIEVDPSGAGMGAGARLEGTGRLVKVGRSGGRKVASIRSETRLPLSATTRVGEASVGLEGVETTESTTSRSLSDGAVQESSALTRGDYRLTLAPPASSPGPPVEGTMSVEVRSETRRVEPKGTSRPG